jgi:hypothetical protein
LGGALYRLGHTCDLALCLVEFTVELHHPNPEQYCSNHQDHCRGRSELPGAVPRCVSDAPRWLRRGRQRRDWRNPTGTCDTEYPPLQLATGDFFQQGKAQRGAHFLGFRGGTDAGRAVRHVYGDQ